MTEAWRPVEGFEGIYEVSDLGRVRRIVGGKGVRYVPYVLAPRPTRKGYTRVRLANRDYAIHRLVLCAFLGPAPSESHQGNHRDGVKTNNALINLEWSTPEENAQHAYDSGLNVARRGEATGRAKLTAAQVHEIRALRGSEKQSDLAERYGVAKSLIWAIQTRRIWTHLPEEIAR